MELSQKQEKQPELSHYCPTTPAIERSPTGDSQFIDIRFIWEKISRLLPQMLFRYDRECFVSRNNTQLSNHFILPLDIADLITKIKYVQHF